MTWSEVGSFATVVYAAVTVAAAGLVFWQIRVARQTFQGQTLLELILQLQEQEVRLGRGRLYELVEKQGASIEQLHAERLRLEPSMQIIDTLAIMLTERMLPERPILDAWGGMVARMWCASEDYIRWRRSAEQDDRFDLWMGFESLGRRCIDLERDKPTPSGTIPWWLEAWDTRRRSAEGS